MQSVALADVIMISFTGDQPRRAGPVGGFPFGDLGDSFGVEGVGVPVPPGGKQERHKDEYQKWQQ